MLGGIKMAFNSFLLGVGFRGFPVYYEQYYRPPSQTLYNVFESHTLPVQIFAELGIIGLTLFAIILIRYYKFAAASILQIKQPTLRACQIGTLASMIGLLTNSMLSPGMLEHNFLWIGLGLTFAIDRMAREDGADLGNIG